MENEPQDWQNCGQVALDNGWLLTLLSRDGGARRSISVSADNLEIYLDMTNEQAWELSQLVIGPPLTEYGDNTEGQNG